MVEHTIAAVQGSNMNRITSDLASYTEAGMMIRLRPMTSQFEYTSGLGSVLTRTCAASRLSLRAA